VLEVLIAEVVGTSVVVGDCVVVGDGVDGSGIHTDYNTLICCIKLSI